MGAGAELIPGLEPTIGEAAGELLGTESRGGGATVAGLLSGTLVPGVIGMPPL